MKWLFAATIALGACAWTASDVAAQTQPTQAEPRIATSSGEGNVQFVSWPYRRYYGGYRYPYRSYSPYSYYSYRPYTYNYYPGYRYYSYYPGYSSYYYPRYSYPYGYGYHYYRPGISFRFGW